MRSAGGESPGLDERAKPPSPTKVRIPVRSVSRLMPASLDDGSMETRRERAVRGFVGVSLVLGAFVLFGGAIQYGTLAGAPGWIVSLAGLIATFLAIVTAAAERGRGNPS